MSELLRSWCSDRGVSGTALPSGLASARQDDQGKGAGVQTADRLWPVPVGAEAVEGLTRRSGETGGKRPDPLPPPHRAAAAGHGELGTLFWVPAPPRQGALARRGPGAWALSAGTSGFHLLSTGPLSIKAVRRHSCRIPLSRQPKHQAPRPLQQATYQKHGLAYEYGPKYPRSHVYCTCPNRTSSSSHCLVCPRATRSGFPIISFRLSTLASGLFSVLGLAARPSWADSDRTT